MIASRLEGSRFLDLCAGSGAVGIEAVSRGATKVTFVDQSHSMYRLIQENLKLCGIGPEQAEVIPAEASVFLRHRAGGASEAWDVVFFDPPYASDYTKVLGYLGSKAGTVLSSDGILIVEHGRKTTFEDSFGSLKRVRVLKQGDSVLSFYVWDDVRELA